jgi:hypothetical protein
MAKNAGAELVELCRRWAAFTGVFIRYAKNESLYETVASLALEDDKPFTRASEKGGANPAAAA